MRIYIDKHFKWLVFEHGIACTECFCPHRSKCKRNRSFKWHNFSVRVSRFLYRHFNIDWHIPITHRYKIEANLSGTPLCPCKLERRYSCWDCQYQAGIDEYCKGLCGCKERAEAIKNGTYDFVYDRNGESRCQYFELSDYGNRWDRRTGERIF